MKRHRYDLVIVGAGSGGYAAARTARDLGAAVALVDEGPLGGLCILRGCMPSKALLASSDAAHDARAATGLGIHAGSLRIDMPFIAQRKRTLIQEFADYRIDGLNAFPLHIGKARFHSAHELHVGDEVVLEAAGFIVATGSRVAPAVIPGLSEAGYLDSDSVLELERIPKSVIVLGGGYTACELGQFLFRMGAKTTMVIRSGHLLTDQDDDIGNALTEYYRDDGITVVDHARVVRIEKRDGMKSVRVVADGVEADLVAEEIFYALGRVPNVDGLSLELADVNYHPMTGIDVDATLRTSNPSIFAVGDVTGDYPLVHVAIYQGEIAARNAIGNGNEAADYSVVAAHTIFSDPQIGIVGANEKRLKRDGVPYVMGRYDFAEHGKAQCLDKTHGFVKMMADPHSGKIVGAAVIGPQGSELIHEVIVAMSFNATVQQFMRIPHLHPTLAEIWTYPAEECSALIGAARAGDVEVEVAASGTAG
ncbi:MAG: dihydrolipoyl dehydrogenase family protein [Vulcanimicrobiaceae bacterium]